MNEIKKNQKPFYLIKFKKYCYNSRALGWNSRECQYLRFQKISELFRYEKFGHFTVHEVGCGLGHFKSYLDENQWNVRYSGSDIVEDFIDTCRKKFPDCSFYVENIANDLDQINSDIKGGDYYCLSGTFNPKGDTPIDRWEKFIFKSIENMYNMANKGICVNFLTTYCDYFNDNLYYADPGRIIDWSIRKCSRFISFHHDIPLYEYFMYIYKEDFLKEIYPGYSKYFR